MIDHIIAAPKHMSVEAGLAFTLKHQLGYEIPGFVEPEVLENPDTEIAQWKSRLEDVKGVLSMHGPVYDLNPVSWDPLIQEASRRRYRQVTAAAKALGCRYLVIHSQYNSIFSAANVKDEWLSASVDYWRQFAEEELDNTPTLTIVLENFMEEPDLLKRLIEGVNHQQIKACLDTGHANLYSSAPVTEWVDVLEHHLAYIHSHNNYGQWDEHRGYAYGTVDMEAFLNHMVRSPYKLTPALEIFHQPELEESYGMLTEFLKIQAEHLPEKTFLI